MTQLSFAIKRIIQLTRAELNPEGFSADKRLNLTKQKLRKQITPAEKSFISILKRLKIRFIFQKGFVFNKESFIVVDFYIPKPHKIVFEIDGDHHKELNQNTQDNRRTYYLEKHRSVKVYRFSNSEVLMNQKVVTNKVRKIIKL